MDAKTPNRELFEKVVTEYMGITEEEKIESTVKNLIRMLIG